MFKTILVPTDGSPLAEKAIHAAIEFARGSGSTLIGFSVAEPYPFSALSDVSISIDTAQYDQKMEAIAHDRVKIIADAAAAAGVPCQTAVALSFSPYEEIIKAANRFHCDVIFMASHGRKGLDKLFVGSETQKVLANSTIPVMIFR
jgi:nucleotide-binding universal stress UspA family protein